jgi:protein gp37
VGDRSSIEWTEATWNPVTGCDRVSPGCDNCYAERLQAMGNARYADGFAVTLHPDGLDLPLRWRTPRRVFVNSMSDLFHPKVPIGFIEASFEVMVRAPHHTFQILTKRPKRAVALADKLPWPSNIWLGVSVEDQPRAWRVDELRKVPTAVRFLSVEPLLGPVDLDLTGISWVIVGGESGPGLGPWTLNGLGTSETPAGARMSRSSSSSGEAAPQRPVDGSSTEKPGTRIPWLHQPWHRDTERGLST